MKRTLPPERLLREGIFWAAIDLGTDRAMIQRMDLPEGMTNEENERIEQWVGAHGHPFPTDADAFDWVTDRALAPAPTRSRTPWVTQACRVAIVALAAHQQDRAREDDES